MSVGVALSSPARGIAHMLVATLCFAGMDAMSKHLTGSYSPVEILWVRFVCFAVFAVVVCGGLTRAMQDLGRVASAPIQILRAFLLVVEMALFVLALRFMGIADAHVLLATGPLVVTGLFGSMLWGMVPVVAGVGISWQGHLFGWLGGLLVARTLGRGLTDDRKGG